MDFKLKGSDTLTPAIEAQLAKTQVLVILLSPGWLESSWCQDELKIFCRHVPNPKGRIFVLELNRIAAADKPALLHDLLTYRFWRQTEQDKVRQLGYPVPQTADTAYHDKLADLSDDLVEILRVKLEPQTEPSPPKPTVYVPTVNHALTPKREKLISEFNQFDIAVLPQDNDWDEGTMSAELALCTHFVQLLDTDALMGIPYKQHAMALTANKVILQWRDPSLDCADVAISAKQKNLLEGKTVIAAPLSDFSRMVREKVLPKAIEPPPVNKTGKKEMVFVHAAPADIARAQVVANQLKAAGYNIALPRYEGDADSIHKTIERGYQYCNALLMVHHAAAALCVEDSLAEAFGYLEKRPLFPPMMICQSHEAEELQFTPPDVHTFTCGTRFEAACLDRFLAEVAHG